MGDTAATQLQPAIAVQLAALTHHAIGLQIERACRTYDGIVCKLTCRGNRQRAARAVQRAGEAGIAAAT